MIRLFMLLNCFFCVGIFDTTFGQVYDYTNTDQTTEKLFVEKNWATLLTESKKAIQNGTNFYNLRIRRGIAYIYQKKYKLAVIEFEAAQHFFPADTVGKYYLCLAHNELGNQAQAQSKANRLPETLRKELNMKKQTLLEAGVFGSYAFFDAENKLPDIVQKETGEWNAYRGLAGGGVYIKHLAGKRLSFTHTASSFAFQNFKKVNYPAQKVIFYNDGVQIGGGTTMQIALPKQWKANLACQYNHIATYTETFNQTKSMYEVTKFSKGGILAGGYIEKGCKNVDIIAGSYWNNFLQYYTLQETVGITYYPFSNTKLFLRANISFLQNLAETYVNYQQTKLILLKANAQMYKTIWLSASYLRGDTQNFFDIENNAIYYTADRTKQQFQSNLYFLLTKNLRLSVGYTWLERSSDRFITYNRTSATTQAISYFAHQISTLLAWKF